MEWLANLFEISQETATVAAAAVSGAIGGAIVGAVTGGLVDYFLARATLRRQQKEARHRSAAILQAWLVNLIGLLHSRAMACKGHAKQYNEELGTDPPPPERQTKHLDLVDGVIPAEDIGIPKIADIAQIDDFAAVYSSIRRIVSNTRREMLWLEKAIDKAPLASIHSEPFIGHAGIEMIYLAKRYNQSSLELNEILVRLVEAHGLPTIEPDPPLPPDLLDDDDDD